MSNKFQLHLTNVLSEELGTEELRQDLINLASELRDNISKWKVDIEDAELRINHILEELNSSLGREIRKIQPKMDIGLRNGACACGYRSRDVICKPDLDKGIWQVSGRLGGPIRRGRPECLRLANDTSGLARAIVDTFKKHYRTL